jgi:hypothetical protein
MTPHDTQLFWRTLGASFLVLALVLGVVLATDEAYSTAQMRVARLCAFAPLIAGVALVIELGRAERRGELRALAGLGASPWGAAWGGLCAAWLFGGVGSLVVLTPLADVSALFPEPPVTSGWTVGTNGFYEPKRGLEVVADGTVRFLEPGAGRAAFSKPGGWQAMSTLLPQALVLPAWLAAPLRPRTRAWGFGLTLAFTLLALHAAALGRLSAILLPLVAAPIGAQLAVALERSRNQVTVFAAMLGRTRSQRYP